MKSRTRRFRGNVTDVVAKRTATSPITLSAAPIRASGVKRAWDIDPAALRGAAGLGLTFLRDLPRRCLVHVAVLAGSSCSARSRAAARTDELEAS